MLFAVSSNGRELRNTDDEHGRLAMQREEALDSKCFTVMIRRIRKDNRRNSLLEECGTTCI